MNEATQENRKKLNRSLADCRGEAGLPISRSITPAAGSIQRRSFSCAAPLRELHAFGAFEQSPI